MSKSGLSRSRNRLILGAFLLLLLLCVVAGAWLTFGRSAQARDLGPSVYIITPVTGAIYEVGTQVRITASGEDLMGMTRLELYVNGVLTAVQESALPGGSTPLMGFETRWTPAAVGRYLLMARGYRSDGRFADSSIVLADVVARSETIRGPLGALLPVPADRPCPSLNQIAAALGISLEDLLVLNPDLRGTDADLPLSCGTVITLPRPTTPPPGLDRGSPPGGSGGTPGGTPPGGSGGTPPGGSDAPGSGPAPLPGVPSIPGWLTVDPSACTSVNLEWTDTPDEDAYLLYRRAPGDSHLVVIANLPADQTTYTDSLAIAGDYYYQVAAVRGGLEALSATQFFNTLDYVSCSSSLPSSGPSASSLFLILPDLQTERLYEGAYCYLSVNGGAQGRFPSAAWSYLSPLRDGLSYDLRLPPARGIYTLNPTGADPVTLYLFCLGRHGVFSDPLGSINASHLSGDWDGRNLTSSSNQPGDGFTIHYCITPDPTRTSCGDGGPDVSGIDVPGRPPLTLPGIDVPYLPNLPLSPVILAVDLPAPTNLRLENGITACDEFPSSADQWQCMLTIVSGGVPQLAWDWTGAPPFTESTLTGYHVVATRNGSPWHDWDVHPGSRKITLASTADMPCGTTVTYQVTAVQGTLQSAPSEAFTYAAPACPPATRARVRVIFNSLTLGPSPLNGRIYDGGDVCIGECPSNQFEMEVSLIACELRDDGSGCYWGGGPHNLHWQGFATGEPFVRLNAPGEYNLADQLLSTDYLYGGRRPTGLSGNNVIVFDLVGSNPALHFSFIVDEHDYLGVTAQDAHEYWDTPRRPIADWATVNETYVISEDFAHGIESYWFGLIHDDIGTTVSVTVIGEPLP